jgi:hypothetical protein
MNIVKNERRLFKRVYFSKNTEIKGSISIIKTGEKASPLIINIMNLSAEGAELSLKRTEGQNLDTKYYMTLDKIMSCKDLEFCTDIEFEIKRIVDIAELDNILLGCYFHGLSEDTKSKINDFVIAELERQKQA